jgi:hypothetical protein
VKSSLRLCLSNLRAFLPLPFLLIRCLLFIVAGSIPLGSLLAEVKVPALPPNQRSFDFYEHGPYRAELPRPSAVLGYEAGDFQTTYAQYETLLREYQQHSDRLRVTQIGQTQEHRKLYLLAISSANNLAHLEEFKDQLGKLADPRALGNSPELEQIFAKTPVVVWLSYSIHGSESAAFECGIQVLYQLLASDDAALEKALDQTIILINPCQNPDGHERFVTWYNAHGAGRPENYSFEHHEPWSITGRLNHNFFDLNRDLISLSQPESRAATAAFLQWHPQVLADHHGQVKDYFFPPPALPINPNLPDSLSNKWLDLFGKSNAAAFDKLGWSYYVRDVFDLFYPGYWDSWSSLHGATGMTYETDGGGPRGYQWLRSDGTLLTLRDGIAKHFTASLNTVMTAAANREPRLRDYREFFAASISGLHRKYYIVPGKDPETAMRLVGLLRRQGIEVFRTNSELRLANGKDYYGGEAGNKMIPSGSFVVDTAQPYGRMANALLEIETPQDADFVNRQEQLRSINEAKGSEETKEEYEFYDVTAWSLPLAMGVETYFSDEALRGELLPVDSAPYPALFVRTGTGLIEGSVQANKLTRGVAYAFEPGSIAAMRLAGLLIQKGYRVETSNDPIRAMGRLLSRGAFLLRGERNPAGLEETLQSSASAYGVPIQTIVSGFPDQGQRGIGSEAVFPLKAPKVALLAGTPTAQISYGLMRFFLEQSCGIGIVPVGVDALQPENLSDFNVLILPDGRPAQYKKDFDEKTITRLREWISNGGTLICMGGSSQFASDPQVNLTSSRLIGTDDQENEDRKSGTNKADSAPSATPGKKGEGSTHRPLRLPGAIVKARVNHHSFLTIGYDSDTIPFLVQGDAFFKPSDTGENALSFGEDRLKISGFFWKDNSEQLLRGTAALIDEPLKKGRVILFSTEPAFRMIWYSTARLLLNAIIYGPSQPQEDDD